MMQQTVKAVIYNEDTNQSVVVCMFNPVEYSITKTNSWNVSATPDSNVPLTSFSAAGGVTLSVNNLLFDTYAVDTTAQDTIRGSTAVTRHQDVRVYTQKVFDLMKIDTSKTPPRPPVVSFRWGGNWFRSVITRVSQKLTLFTPSGVPVRAKLDIDFQQVDDLDRSNARTNPTSFAQTYKVRTVLPGETIDAIAFQEYGDPRYWTRLADFNGLDDPLRLFPGQRLAIPPVR